MCLGQRLTNRCRRPKLSEEKSRRARRRKEGATMQNQIDMKGFIQIALVVNDIEKAAKKWAELFGVPVPPNPR